ncbi:hypothetical protein SAMN05444278_10426 [Psychroflexus salarius]|uniref:Uncharacterized protein n=1 Tax=Psychroflexus salarius TaxID=1155689 RepID=A0A1M4VEY3_9FLAO|nr:hypothetical protein [Psychroflexus salarius]SHE67519.1 hypothetical protein SAMN05444278_10426 [Psychroflexus salarius]
MKALATNLKVNHRNIVDLNNISPEKDSSLIKLSNSSQSIQLMVAPNEGGRVKSLKFRDYEIIGDLSQTSYQENYASAVLFPFAGSA